MARYQSHFAARRALARRLMMGLAATVVCQGALAQVMYRIRPLGTLNGCTVWVLAFNNADQATGEACSPDGNNTDAFLWKHDGTPPVDLGPSEHGYSGVGSAINASGLVTGYVYGEVTYSFLSSGNGAPMQRIYDPFGGTQIAAIAMNDAGQLTGNASVDPGAFTYHAFVWKNNGAPARDIGTFGGDVSTGVDINAAAQVAGYSNFTDSGPPHAFIWKNDGTPIQDLGTLGGASSRSVAINASGQITGGSLVPGAGKHEHAFFWANDGTPMQDLGAFGGHTSVAVALNDAGQVAGNSTTGPGRTDHAFLWLNNGTRIKDLGTLGGPTSTANDLNNSGQVTGTASTRSAQHAFLWRNDGTAMQDLNKLIDPRDPLKASLTFTAGYFINDSGDIIALGQDVHTRVSTHYLLHGTVIRLTPRSLAFGNQAIGTASAAKSVTVTNTSSNPVPFTGTGLTGPAVGQYLVSDNCGSSLEAHASCAVELRFRPTSAGPKRGFLKLNGGDGGLLLVQLTGTGT